MIIKMRYKYKTEEVLSIRCDAKSFQICDKRITISYESSTVNRDTDDFIELTVLDDTGKNIIYSYGDPEFDSYDKLEESVLIEKIKNIRFDTKNDADKCIDKVKTLFALTCSTVSIASIALFMKTTFGIENPEKYITIYDKTHGWSPNEIDNWSSYASDNKWKITITEPTKI